MSYNNSMVLTRSRLFNKHQTANNIKSLVDKYYNDIDSIKIRHNGRLTVLSQLPLNVFFNFVKNIKYRQDKTPVEIISRPGYIIRHRDMGMDCKKKGILIASYLHKNRIPYRFICSSSRPNKKIHHIFPQAYLLGKWNNIDATYNIYRMGKPKTVTKAEYL